MSNLRSTVARRGFRAVRVAFASVFAAGLVAPLLVQGEDRSPAPRPAVGAAPAAARPISWRSGAVQLPAIAADDIAKALDAAAGDARRIVVQFDRPLTLAERAATDADGLRLLAYVGENAFFASVDGARLNSAALAATGRLLSVADVRREWKLHRDYLAGDIAPWTIVEGGIDTEDADGNIVRTLPVGVDPQVAAVVMFHRDVTLGGDGVEAALASGAAIQTELPAANAMVVHIAYSSILALADEDSVQWIEPPLPAFTELNDNNRTRVGADVAAAPPYGLDGGGVVAMIYDSGQVSATHPDFAGRLTVPDIAELNGVRAHSTHVAGTVAGSGAESGGVYRGMAPGATIVSYSFETGGPLQQGFLYTDPGDLVADYTEGINTYSADITNNSIGTNTAPNGFPCEWEGDYGVTDTLIDELVRGSAGAPHRVVWAAGNERSGSARCGNSYRTTAPPANAKNHLTVGALNSNDDSMTSFSSWGPSDDGRLKPDVAGPGCQVGGDGGVTSCNYVAGQTGGYNDLCGTSMAAPTVTGMACLVLQDYRNEYPGQPDPPNAMLRAIFAQTAVDLGNPGPDYQFGYGSVRVIPAIDLVRSGNLAQGVLSQGEQAELQVIVEPGATELKVTMAWDDVQGTANVVPALVNDLELRVIDAASTRYYSWTLDPATPSANAVRTQDNTLDNLEQIRIDNPPPGVYRVEVFGRNVSSGPQPFSLVASSLLVNCTSRGIAAFNAGRFPCATSAELRVSDCDLNLDDNVVETLNVLVTSTSEPAGEALTLTETAAASAAFAATIPVSTTDAPGTLLVAAGDTLAFTYIDADDGDGGTNVPVTATATIDCAAPQVSDVAVTNIQPRRATITFVTDEAARATLRYGLSCASLDQSVSPPAFRTSHSFDLTGLNSSSNYYFAIDTVDSAGNASTHDNGGACYAFTTERAPNYYTELYSATDGGPPDLAGSSLLFTPDGSIDFYAGCRTPTVALPTDPAGGTDLPLTNANALEVQVGAPGIPFFGVVYQSFFVSNNGNITFGVSNTDSTETITDHFSVPRIAGVWDDINPTLAGADVSWRRTADRVAVTFLAVPGTSTGEGPNTFQIEMFFDGRIQITWLQIGSLDAIIGLSAGTYDASLYQDTDLSALAGCGPRPPTVAPSSVDAPTGRPIAIALIAGDDGLPDPPGALLFRVTSLPQGELRDAGSDHLISPAELPYTLSGDTVRYQSAPGFLGGTSFNFVADDGGTPPDGGSSSEAVVNITVQPVIALPFEDQFATTTFDPARWGLVADATIDTAATNPPSPPLSARLNGNPDGADEIRTQLIDLAGLTQVRLEYAWQRTGTGDSPEANDDLFVEFQRADGQWQLLNRLLGSGADMTTFQAEQALLPTEALHAGFRLRFRTASTPVGAFDDWFVDNVRIYSLDTPVAANGGAQIAPNTTVTIALSATDPNGDPLDFTIESLPASGTLTDPETNQPIAAAPYMLAAGGNEVRYRPANGFAGDDSFTFSASDGVNVSNIATIAIGVGGRIAVHLFPLDTNPGWTTEPDWAFGQPTGGGSFNRDPTSGFTGTNVFGYNLLGNYAPNIQAPRYLTTGAIDCSDLQGTQLRFRRWLGIESAAFDQAAIEISTDGAAWQFVWQHSGTAAIADTSWQLLTYDVAAVADGEATVYFRWSLGPTDASSNYPGWNIDDVEIWGIPPAIMPGDVNCDGLINFFDIDPFVLALFDPAAYAAQYPSCNISYADVSGDGLVNFFDIDPFVAVLFP